MSHSLPLFTLALGLIANGLVAGTPSGHDEGMVFTSTNAQVGNELLVYARTQNGSLTLRHHLATGGLGSNAGLGSQGAVTLSVDGRFVFVVNAQSNTLSTFALRGNEPVLTSVVPSGGLHPISVTEHEGVVYVLNDGGNGNVAGFRNIHGHLHPISGSVRGLSRAGGTAPAQVGFSEDGDTLVVTEKGTNRLTSYEVMEGDGSISSPIVTPSVAKTPFGFAFNRRNRLLVTEAVGGAPGASSVSSYRFIASAPTQPQVVSAAVPTTQTAACWIAITPNGRFAYVTNAGSSSVSSYRIQAGGQIELLNAVAGQTGSGSAPIDDAISADGRHLYVRNAGTLTITSYAIDREGNLEPKGTTTDLPGSAVGLAAN
jgi:6-phosphogluconolactonase (cycloisomerase 2 family)